MPQSRDFAKSEPCRSEILILRPAGLLPYAQEIRKQSTNPPSRTNPNLLLRYVPDRESKPPPSATRPPESTAGANAPRHQSVGLSDIPASGDNTCDHRTVRILAPIFNCCPRQELPGDFSVPVRIIGIGDKGLMIEVNACVDDADGHAISRAETGPEREFQMRVCPVGLGYAQPPWLENSMLLRYLLAIVSTRAWFVSSGEEASSPLPTPPPPPPPPPQAEAKMAVASAMAETRKNLERQNAEPDARHSESIEALLKLFSMLQVCRRKGNRL